MNVVFLSPHFPPNWFRFVVALRSAGATTLGLVDVNWDQLQPELRDRSGLLLRRFAECVHYDLRQRHP